jgi:hypothetical protein
MRTILGALRPRAINLVSAATDGGATDQKKAHQHQRGSGGKSRRERLTSDDVRSDEMLRHSRKLPPSPRRRECFGESDPVARITGRAYRQPAPAPRAQDYWHRGTSGEREMNSSARFRKRQRVRQIVVCVNVHIVIAIVLSDRRCEATN